LVEYHNYRSVVSKEAGKAVSALTDTKLVAVGYFRCNESIIAFQGVAISDSLAVHMRTLQATHRSPEFSRGKF
jgi:hypothetical protein